MPIAKKIRHLSSERCRIMEVSPRFGANFPCGENLEVQLRQAVAGKCPPDTCIEWFKSDLPILQKEKGLPKQVFFLLEVSPRFELGNEGFADPCLTTWL